jgi:hypothetical protein
MRYLKLLQIAVFILYVAIGYQASVDSGPDWAHREAHPGLLLMAAGIHAWLFGKIVRTIARWCGAQWAQRAPGEIPGADLVPLARFLLRAAAVIFAVGSVLVTLNQFGVSVEVDGGAVFGHGLMAIGAMALAWAAVVYLFSGPWRRWPSWQHHGARIERIEPQLPWYPLQGEILPPQRY